MCPYIFSEKELQENSVFALQDQQWDTFQKPKAGETWEDSKSTKYALYSLTFPSAVQTGHIVTKHGPYPLSLYM